MTEYGARNHSGVVSGGLNVKASPSSAFYRKSSEEVEAESSGKGSGTVPKSTSERAQEEPEANWITFEATAYVALCDSGCTGITATGYDVRNTIHSPKGHRVIAVDPSVVPLGALVAVKLADGTTFKARAMDTGSAIKGRRIDLLIGSVKEAKDFGRRDVKVRVLD